MLSLMLLALAAARPTTEMRRFPADEAHQGVAAGEHYVYAVANREIGQYDKNSGQRLRRWRGDREHFRHINSCSVVGAELVCAASNYPDLPMQSRAEFFDAETLRHQRTRPLGSLPGSLTAFMRHGGKWWAIIANYDRFRFATGRDHRATSLVRLDERFGERTRWRFPDDVLARFSPNSCSGASWGSDGLLYVTGHDRRELYALQVPPAGGALRHVATFALPTAGQAIAWDPVARNRLWSIDRKSEALVVTYVPPLPRPGRSEKASPGLGQRVPHEKQSGQ